MFKTWFELLRVKLYRNDLKGNKKLLQVSRMFELSRVQVTFIVGKRQSKQKKDYVVLNYSQIERLSKCSISSWKVSPLIIFLSKCLLKMTVISVLSSHE